MQFNLEKVIRMEYICLNSVGTRRNVAAIPVSVLSPGTIMAPILIFSKKGRLLFVRVVKYTVLENKRPWKIDGPYCDEMVNWLRVSIRILYVVKPCTFNFRWPYTFADRKVSLKRPYTFPGMKFTLWIPYDETPKKLTIFQLWTVGWWDRKFMGLGTQFK